MLDCAPSVRLLFCCPVNELKRWNLWGCAFHLDRISKNSAWFFQTLDFVESRVLWWGLSRFDWGQSEFKWGGGIKATLIVKRLGFNTLYMKDKQRKETLRKDGQLVKMRTKYEKYWVQSLKNAQAFDLRKNPNVRSQNLRFYYLIVKSKSKRYKKDSKESNRMFKNAYDESSCEPLFVRFISQLAQDLVFIFLGIRGSLSIKNLAGNGW